jgi:DNA polymerase-3 subunit gamma/tau
MANALYRQYRPDTLDDVIGEPQVTVPLARALDSGRLVHAYLFSGPRGCGKTSTARIFARCLNCAEGPTSAPCGKCESCIELATGGTGSIDVTEIDAASHGGVEDARSLRDQVSYMPSRDRFKIFIIDEAHMVTKQGFNALLKTIEEPPEHVKFIFATTEYQKVITTIRSRTHHYPFKLVSAEILTPFLRTITEKEGYEIEESVLNLLVRASEGSVRDSLSILDQLLASAKDKKVDYETSALLLGITPDAVIESLLTALAISDSAKVFEVLESVISTGQDEKNFANDLLEYLRNLLLLTVSNNAKAKSGADSAALSSVLFGIPKAEIEVMNDLSAKFGFNNILKLSDIVANSVNNIANSFSPRVYFELLGANLLTVIDNSLTTTAIPQAQQPQSAPAEKPAEQPQPVNAESEPVPVTTEPEIAQSSSAMTTGGDHAMTSDGSSAVPKDAEPEPEQSEPKQSEQKTEAAEPQQSEIDINKLFASVINLIREHNGELASFLENSIIAHDLVGDTVMLQFRDENDALEYEESGYNSWVNRGLQKFSGKNLTSAVKKN